VRAENPSIPFLPLIKYRLSVFGLSYFTPGPQVGGEPLQVFYLKENHGLSFARATSAVIMDKLLEFLANFILIGIGLTAAVRVGMVSPNGTQALGSLIPMVLILAWPVIHLILLSRGKYPISGLLRAATSLLGDRDWVRLIMISERMAASFTRRKFPALLAGLFFSLVAWAGMAAEYFLMADFLSASLSFEQILAALTAALLAFLLPLPGGLGALEASQVYALTMMGYAPSIGISLSLIMRARDILNGGIGLLLAGKFVRDINR
jgi:glycosyltransferase 2 family protein